LIYDADKEIYSFLFDIATWGAGDVELGAIRIAESEGKLSTYKASNAFGVVTDVIKSKVQYWRLAFPISLEPPFPSVELAMAANRAKQLKGHLKILIIARIASSRNGIAVLTREHLYPEVDDPLDIEVTKRDIAVDYVTLIVYDDRTRAIEGRVLIVEDGQFVGKRL
jgi:hypothetical protein